MFLYFLFNIILIIGHLLLHQDYSGQIEIIQSYDYFELSSIP